MLFSATSKLKRGGFLKRVVGRFTTEPQNSWLKTPRKSGGQQKSSQLENFWFPAKHFTPLKTNMTLENAHVQRENTSSGGGCSIVMFVLGGGYHFGTWRVNQNFETLRSWLFSIPNTCNMQPPPPISSGKEETSHSPAT